MKKIIYYITDHGLGHTTRSIAIIRELQKLDFQIIVRNTNAQDMLKKSLKKIKIIPGKTDTGTIINSDGFSINETKSKIALKRWIKNLPNYVDEECTFITKIKPNLVISDISLMPLLASKKVGVTNLAISNFSWYDVLKFLPKKELAKIKTLYNSADFTIQLPLGTKMNHFKNKIKTGLVSRKITKSRHDIRNQFGIKNSEFLVLFALGDSKTRLNFQTTSNVRIFSMNTKINPKLNPINVSNWIESQDLISASDLVFCKCGYGIVSECLVSGTPFYYVYSKNHFEQRGMSRYLIKKGIKTKISLDKINQFNFSSSFISSLSRNPKEPIDTGNVVKFINEIIH